MTQRETLQRLASEARPFYPRLALAFVLSGIGSALMVVWPAAFGKIVNLVIVPAAATAGGHVSAPPDLSVFYIGLGATFLSLVFSNFATYGSTYITAWS